MFIFFAFSSTAISAEEVCDSVPTDSINIEDNDSLIFYPLPKIETDYSVAPNFNATEIPLDSIPLFRKAPKWLRDYLNSLLNGNVDKTFEKPVDLGFAIVPSYSKESSFGLSGAMTGSYRVNKTDSTLQPSNFSASLSASLLGSFDFTAKGNHVFSDHRSRLTYKAELYSKHLDFWGVTAEATRKNRKSPSEYTRRQADLTAEYKYRLNSRFYIGANARANYTAAKKVGNIEYLNNERDNYFVTGLGLSLEFDSRNDLVTPSKGVYLAYKPMIFPNFMGNAPSTFYSHNIIADGYFKMWKGSVLAIDIYAKLNSSNTPWTMREMVAGDWNRMRGYYMGSTIDNNQISTQIELRQHIWHRFGLVVWGGGASFFSNFDQLKRQKINDILYNYGIGLRFEFKHNTNIRLDWGFGKDTNAVIVTIGEAF
ncbi:MAG: BamA/TamA family outer membrane protein [Muribaculaceae bacterium]|nr:BamA/TamA family outer membrane protein [Muribaculaceae bacterium]